MGFVLQGINYMGASPVPVDGGSSGKAGHATWLFCLMIIEFFYIVIELGFNSALLNVSGGLTSDKASYDSVIEWGRILSGVGFGLLIFGFMRRKKKSPSLESEFFPLLITLVFAIPFMYVTQKIIIDNIFVHPTSGEDRADAQKLLILKHGLSRGEINFTGVPVTGQGTKDPAQLTYLSLLPSLVINDKKFIRDMEGHLQGVIYRTAQKESDKVLPELYKEYRSLDDKMKPMYESYIKISNEYKKQGFDDQAVANKAWSKVDTKINEGWAKYFEYASTVETSMERNIGRIKEYYRDYQHGVAKCTKVGSCQDRYLRQFKIRSKTMTRQTMTPQEFCQGARCPGTDLHIRNVLTKYKSKTLEEYTGYPYGIRNRQEFVSHPKTIASMQKVFRAEGIHMPHTWKGDRDTFFNTVRNTMHTEFFNKAILKNGYGLNPSSQYKMRLGLPYKDFEQEEKIQVYFQENLAQFYTEKFKLGMSQVDFNDAILLPKLKVKISEKLTSLARTPQELGPGGKYEEEGKDYMRAAIIPPIALVLSLFFCIFAALKLPLRILTISWILCPKPWKIHLRRTLMVLDLAAVMSLPLKRFDNDFTKSKSVQNSISHFEKEAGTKAAYAFKWLMHAEPVLYPIGMKILKSQHKDNRDAEFR